MPALVTRLIWFLLGGITVAVLVFVFRLQPASGPGPAAHVPPRDVISLPANVGQLRDGALTSLYPLTFEKVPAPAPVGRAGAIAAAGEHTLLITRQGALHALGAEGFERLSVPPPVDVAAIEAGLEFARQRQRMGIHDMVTRQRPGGWQIFVSHPVHTAETACLQLRVSAITLPDAALRPGGPVTEAAWRAVFTSEPCIDTERNAVSSLGGGGMALTSETTLMVGVGTFSITAQDGRGIIEFLHSTETHYGKLVEVDLASGSAKVFARGLRDPNGLVPEPDGSFLTTEHGPRGGDELNRVREGLNYGWPLATYGTDYYAFSWPLEKQPGGHAEFEPPLFAWVPSIAVSTAIRIEGRALARWKGDVLVASLKAAHLYRVRFRDGRVVLVEPILIGDRIRDVAETAKGEIMVLLDRHPHVLRITEASSQAEAGPSMIGFCAGCHKLEPADPGTKSGPSLVGLIGRPVAGDPEFQYSEALRAVDGVWTANRLADFLEQPQRFAPGTAMADLDLAPFTLLDVVQWFVDRAADPVAPK